MSKPNAILALKAEDRPKGKSRDERIPAAKVATYLTEAQIQLAVAKYLDLKLPKTWRWFHPPNGGFRKKETAARLKAEGLKPGIPDVCILRPNASPVWIELKAFAGVLSLEQKKFRDWCIEANQPYAVCRSVGEVEQFLKGYMARAT